MTSATIASSEWVYTGVDGFLKNLGCDDECRPISEILHHLIGCHPEYPEWKKILLDLAAERPDILGASFFQLKRHVSFVEGDFEARLVQAIVKNSSAVSMLNELPYYMPFMGEEKRHAVFRDLAYSDNQDIRYGLARCIAGVADDISPRAYREAIVYLSSDEGAMNRKLNPAIWIAHQIQKLLPFLTDEQGTQVMGNLTQSQNCRPIVMEAIRGCSEIIYDETSGKIQCALGKRKPLTPEERLSECNNMDCGLMPLDLYTPVFEAATGMMKTGSTYPTDRHPPPNFRGRYGGVMIKPD